MKSAKSTRPRILLVNRGVVYNKNNEILIIKRSMGDSWKAGEWELPGGKLDIEDDVNKAIEREVLEETGLYIRVISELGYIDLTELKTGKYQGLPYVEIVRECKVIGNDKVFLSEEHDDHCWCSEDKIFDYKLTTETRKALKVILGS